MNKEERREQIAFITDTIHKLCVEYKIGLKPYMNKHGVNLIVIEDATNGDMYLMTRPKEEPNAEV